MKLSLQLILETLTEYGAQLIETDGDFTFTGVQILTSPTDILEPDTLYVCTPKVLPKLKKQLFENHCFVFKAKPSQLQCHHALHGILLDENTDLNEVVNRLITLFTQFHAFEFAIKEASLERRGYEPFFEIAKKAFPHCLIVVTDSAYNIVCSTRSSVDDIPYFRDLLQRGYYSREDMNQIASWGYYEDERKCVQPVLYPAEKTICGYPFLVRSYKNHGAAYCFIGCYFLDVPPTQRDISLYTCLTQELENYYKVNGIFDAGMLGKQQQLLDDLIRPKQNSPEYFHDRCAQLNIPYQGTFRIGLVQCESSTLFKVSHISNQLRAHCPLANYGVFQYGSSVIILFRDWNDANVRTQSGFSEDWNALLTTLRQNKACMGISLLFSDVTKLYVGYRQAEAASNIGKRRDTDGTAYFYSKYYLEDMLEHYADTMPLEDTYTHYLDRLMDDNNSVCSNIKLLYYFLCSERNISLTAKHVHMHRNSVIYRISEDPGHPRAGSRRSGCPSAADDLVQDPRNDRPHPALGNAARRERYRQQRHRASRVTTVSRPLSPVSGESGRFFSSFLHSRLCGGGKKRCFE